MRILKFLFISVIIFALIGGVGWLIAREALLIVGVSQVKTSLSRLKLINKNRDQYNSQCLSLGASMDAKMISAFQLRFISDQEYVLEVICSQFQLSPIQVAQEKLPMFVTKVPGSPGLFWSDSLSGIVLQVWGRQRAILVEQQEIIYQTPSADMSLGAGPATTCEGYGFNCCDSEVTKGSGDQFTGVTDCPRSCFAVCVGRPVILSFVSDPFMDPQTRISQVQSGTAVTFNYIVDSESTLERVKIVYGDGQTEESVDATGSFSHVYACQGECQYQVFLTATDVTGAEAVINQTSKITVEIK